MLLFSQVKICIHLVLG